MKWTITVNWNAKDININTWNEFILINWLMSWDYMQKSWWRDVLNVMIIECKNIWLLKSKSIIENILSK